MLKRYQPPNRAPRSSVFLLPEAGTSPVHRTECILHTILKTATLRMSVQLVDSSMLLNLLARSTRFQA